MSDVRVVGDGGILLKDHLPGIFAGHGSGQREPEMGKLRPEEMGGGQKGPKVCSGWREAARHGKVMPRRDRHRRVRIG